MIPNVGNQKEMVLILSNRATTSLIEFITWVFLHLHLIYCGKEYFLQNLMYLFGFYFMEESVPRSLLLEDI